MTVMSKIDTNAINAVNLTDGWHCCLVGSFNIYEEPGEEYWYSFISVATNAMVWGLWPPLNLRVGGDSTFLP